MRQLAKFMRLSGPDRRLLLEAAVWLGIARLGILVLPFRLIAPFLGRHMAESPQRRVSDHGDIVERVSRVVHIASRHLPWECRCLAQAMAAKGMFRLRRVSSTIYLGLAKEGEDKLKAHAWLRSGDVIVVGTPGINRFTVVSTFAEEKPSMIRKPPPHHY